MMRNMLILSAFLIVLFTSSGLYAQVSDNQSETFYKVGELIESAEVGKQTAILIKQDKSGGVFTVIGTDTDGSDYKGELYVAESKSQVYHFAFHSEGKVKYAGTGVKIGDFFCRRNGR